MFKVYRDILKAPSSMGTFQPPAWSTSPEYQELYVEIKEKKLLDRMPFHYVAMFLVLVGIFTCFFLVLPSVHSVWVTVLLALLMSFPKAWWGYFGHDISHGEVFSSHLLAKIGTIVVWPITLGVSGTYWFTKHNEHHNHVNQIGHDPDLTLPVYFSDSQRAAPNILQRLTPKWVLKHQHQYFFFLFPLLAVTFYLNTIRTLITPPYTVAKAIETVLVALHFIVYYGLIFWLLGFQNGLIFSILNGVGAGIILSLAFAPNHKGQVMFPENEILTWKHQVLATRNLTPSPLIDFLYGGLNYQIEHHLFPSMPRFHLGKARPIIKKFCEAHGVPYHETSPYGSMREIYLALKGQAR